MRTSRPAAIMLSGGIDSSALTAVAARACRERSVPCPSVRALSVSVPGPGDERRYFEAMAAAAGIAGERVSNQQPRPGQFHDEIARDLDVQTFPHAPTLDPLRTLAQEAGARVMLTGMGGDDWLGPSMSAYADLLGTGRLLALLRRWRGESSAHDFPGWRMALQSATWPLFPRPAQHIVRRLLRRGRPPEWIEPAFAARIGLADRLAPQAADVEFETCEQRDLWREGTSGTMVHAIEATTRSGSRFGLVHAMPYLDRRIVEFGLALPGEQRWRNGRSKDLLRRALRHDVPELITSRTWNPAADHVYIEALAAESAGRQASAAEQLGWVRGDHVRALHSRALALYQSGDPRYGWPAWAAWLIRAMDLWLDAANMVQ